MKRNKRASMDLWVVKIDDTMYWSKDVLKKYPEIKRIFSVYMVDINEYTYVASLTPSYFLRFLQNEWNGDYTDDEERNEEIDELMSDNPSDDTYLNVRSVQNAPKIRPGGFPRGRIGRVHWHHYSLQNLRDEFDGNREEAIEEAIEQYQGNPI